MATTALTLALGITDPAAPMSYPTKFLVWNLVLAWIPMSAFDLVERRLWLLPLAWAGIPAPRAVPGDRPGPSLRGVRTAPACAAVTRPRCGGSHDDRVSAFTVVVCAVHRGGGGGRGVLRPCVSEGLGAHWWTTGVNRTYVLSAPRARRVIAGLSESPLVG